MKKLLIAVAIILSLPTMVQAQEVLTPQQKLEQAQKQLEEAQKAVEAAKAEAAKENSNNANKKRAESVGWQVPKDETIKQHKKAIIETETKTVDSKYLAGAVPVNASGKVEFTDEIAAPGKTADQIYDAIYDYLVALVSDENQLEGSRIALVNKEKHTIAATIKEWMVFQNSFLSLDRAKSNYNIVAEITDGKAKLTINRIYYAYEEDRSSGFVDTAENVITDEYGLTKKKNKLARVFGKFRKGTIDRKDKIFSDIEGLLK